MSESLEGLCAPSLSNIPFNLLGTVVFYDGCLKMFPEVFSTFEKVKILKKLFEIFEWTKKELPLNIFQTRPPSTRDIR